MSGLAIERTWLIECWRCSDSDNVYCEDGEQARADFARAGWKVNADGFQMCPRCGGTS